MSYGELIQLYFERSNALQWYWTLYVVVIGGLLAFSSLRQRPDLLTAILVSVLYSFFAFKNCGAILVVPLERYAVLQSIKEYPSGGAAAAATPRVRGLIEPTLNPPAYEGVRNFHIASDMLTLAAVWAMERRRWRRLRDDQLPRSTPPVK